MSNLFPKLLTAILALTLIGLGLLVIRQERYLAAARLTQHHQELQLTERQVWDLQAELARRVTPQRLRELAERHGLSAPRPMLVGEAQALPPLRDPLSDPSPVTEIAHAPPAINPAAGLALVALSETETEDQDEEVTEDD